MNGGRKKWVDEGPTADPRRAAAIRRPTTQARGRTTRDPRVPRRGARAHRLRGRETTGAAARWWTCARRASTAASCCTWPDYPQEGAHARRPHPRRAEHPLGAGGRARTAPSSRPTSCRRSTRARASRRDKDIVAYCRIGERSSPHLVRAARPAGLPERAQLRRLVDRVGQRGRRADREPRGAEVRVFQWIASKSSTCSSITTRSPASPRYARRTPTCRCRAAIRAAATW